MAATALRTPFAVTAIGALAAFNAAVGVMLASALPKAVLLALAPAGLVAVASLIASNRAILAFGALAINLFAPLPLSGALPLPTSLQLYPSDVLVLLAVGSWAAAWLLRPEEARPSSLRSRILGWPLLIFGFALVTALIVGHMRYGTSFANLSVRLFVYAGIAAAMTDLTPRAAYRWLVVFFYAGTVWQVLVAVYNTAAGASATDAVNISTGGERILAGSTAMFMIGALLLALLNVERDRRGPGRTGLHLLMAALATYALANTFARASFALVSLLVPLFLIVYWRTSLRAASFLPLGAPFVAAAALLIPHFNPSLLPTLADRVTTNVTTDASVEWRRKAYATVWAQIREAPLMGSGFGRPATFTLNDVRYTIVQDPHNQFLYLWAGGGLFLLGSFILLLLTYLAETWRRLRVATSEERLLIFWAVALWFVFVANSLSGVILTVPHLLLAFWVLMVLPMTVRPSGSGAARLA